MNEIAGLALFGTIVGLVLCAMFTVLYCGYLAICWLRRPGPLANIENPV